MRARTDGVIQFPVYRSFSSKLVLICGSISSFCWLSVLFHFHHFFSLRHLLNELFRHHYHNLHWWKFYNQKLLPLYAPIVQGLPAYSLSPTIILFFFILASLFPMSNLPSLFRNPNVLTALDTVANFRNILFCARHGRLVIVLLGLLLLLGLLCCLYWREELRLKRRYKRTVKCLFVCSVRLG